ncbi:MAG: Ni/Fe-hydrogenase cytochrome b subunit [Bryobacterales bacterium]|nr:Ni/Fe-hydrogenase cytochrome b subunit [Bryobacterales bacterium]
MTRFLPKTFWQLVFAALMAASAYVTFVRFYHGLGSSTNLNDQFPWGLWIGFDVLCGVGLAAGGFTLAATVHIFHLERFKPIVRPAILTAFIGYLLVIVALMFDLGQPWRIWHPLIMWNPRSVMFEVGWCVTLYTTVLALEFAPVVLERFGLRKPLRILKSVMLPLVIAGVLLSTLHQSSLGSLYLIMPHKLSPLWYSPLLPILFYISAIGVGLAMTIFESYHSSRAFGRQLEFPLVKRLSEVLAVVLAFYLALRLVDMKSRGAFQLLESPGIERWLFGLEMVLMALPMLLLFREKIRNQPRAIYWCSVSYLMGFMAHRMNVAITGIESASGVRYTPKWMEVVITLGLIALGFAVFRWVTALLPIFSDEEERPSIAIKVKPMPVRNDAFQTVAPVR